MHSLKYCSQINMSIQHSQAKHFEFKFNQRKNLIWNLGISSTSIWLNSIGPWVRFIPNYTKRVNLIWSTSFIIRSGITNIFATSINFAVKHLCTDKILFSTCLRQWQYFFWVKEEVLSQKKHKSIHQWIKSGKTTPCASDQSLLSSISGGVVSICSPNGCLIAQLVSQSTTLLASLFICFNSTIQTRANIFLHLSTNNPL